MQMATTFPVTKSDDIPVSRWENAWIPRKCWGLRFDDYHPEHPTGTAALHYAQQFVTNYPARTAYGTPVVGKGLAFFGNPGVGKTVLSAVTAMEAHRQHKANIRFATMADYTHARVEQIKFSKLAEKGDEEAGTRFWQIQRSLDQVQNRPLIILDDVGKEHQTPSDAAVDEFDRLIRNRHNNGKPTIINSNLGMDEWRKIYGSAMYSFLDEAFTLIVMVGRDRRS
jgi:DNA replication protein DnaC